MSLKMQMMYATPFDIYISMRNNIQVIVRNLFSFQLSVRLFRGSVLVIARYVKYRWKPGHHDLQLNHFNNGLVMK